jgi:hypothetical protein
MAHLVANKRYTAVYLKGNRQTLTLGLQDSTEGWTAQLLDNRPPNEARPLQLFSEVVSDPDIGKTLLARKLKDFLISEGWPQQPLVWHESERVDVGPSQLKR